MVRIAEGVWPNEVKEKDYFTAQGQYRVDNEATPTMRNSLMYKMSYYRYNQLFPAGQAVDRVRGATLPAEGPELDTLEEAFTSESWIVRIYKVRKEDNLGRDHSSARAFERGLKKRRRTGARKGRKLRVE
jgi:dolichyl-diphosphooligosaccharide---protein glycosyltransferase